MMAAPTKALCIVELRANFHAAAASDAVRERIAFFLLPETARACAEIVGAVDGNPAFDALEVFEEN